MNNRLLCGTIGTAVSAIGAGLSINELQAIVSIAVTILGFVISVLIPLISKLIKKVKAAKEDGNISESEAQDIAKTVVEIAKETKDFIDSNKENK